MSEMPIEEVEQRIAAMLQKFGTEAEQLKSYLQAMNSKLEKLRSELLEMRIRLRAVEESKGKKRR